MLWVKTCILVLCQCFLILFVYLFAFSRLKQGKDQKLQSINKYRSITALEGKRSQKNQEFTATVDGISFPG